MNGNWFPWAEGVNGNQPGEYVAAWRHVHDIFTSVGATNATWVWCPYVDPEQHLHALAPLYPGRRLRRLDLPRRLQLGNQSRRRPTRAGGASTASSAPPTTRSPTRSRPSKPMVIGETGSTEYGGSKAGWITNMFSWLPSLYPKIRGLLWFEKPWPTGWTGRSRPRRPRSTPSPRGSRAAPYAKNSYGDISKSPIPPPGG